MRLVIAEKPSVAMALASVIGARSRRDGFVEGNGYLVSWCVGHLVGLCDAADYDDRYRKWNYDDLPIVPEKWKKKILEGTKKQFGILQTLMNRNDVTEVICGTDAGREGEQAWITTLEKLPEEDQLLIRLRFYGGKTQSETAKLLHTTQVQISRRERKLLKLMRAKLLEE